MTVEQMTLWSQICLGSTIFFLVAAVAMFFLLEIRKAANIVFGTRLFAASDKKKKGGEKAGRVSTQELMSRQAAASAKLKTGKLVTQTRVQEQTPDNRETALLGDTESTGTTLLGDAESTGTTLLGTEDRLGTILRGTAETGGTAVLGEKEAGGTALLGEIDTGETVLLSGMEEQVRERFKEPELNTVSEGGGLKLIVDLTYIHTPVIL